MTAYRIAVRPEARTALLGLPKPTRRQLQRAIDGLAEDPWPPGAAELSGQPGVHWLRVGHHRVVYTTNTHQVLILLIAVGPRAATGQTAPNT